MFSNVRWLSSWLLYSIVIIIFWIVLALHIGYYASDNLNIYLQNILRLHPVYNGSILALPPIPDSSRVSEQKCYEYTRGTTCKGNYTHIDPNLFEIAEPGEFPYLARVFEEYKSSEGYDRIVMGVGVLISPRFVMSGVICGLTGSVYVSLGDYDGRSADGSTSLKIPVKTIYNHPDYRRKNIHNNIALLELDQPVSFSERVRPACLWTHYQLPSSAVMATLNNSLYHESGFGSDYKIGFAIKENGQCNDLDYRFQQEGVASTQMCGVQAKGNTSWCLAIESSPVHAVARDNNSCSFRVIGLSSFGAFRRRCADTRTVFTRVSPYVDWLEGMVWDDKRQYAREGTECD